MTERCLVQRDVKIGLSLGLLLVVIVAALFFRREPEKTGGPPALADADSLNKAIGERERSPYMLGGPEEFEKPAPPPSVRRDVPAPTQRQQVPSVLSPDDADLHQRALSGTPSRLPDPIRTGTPPLGAETADADDAPIGNGLRTHTIKSGDKLTLLAARYLGSSGRFPEIYNANKSILKNPNNLPVGVTIVIPPRDAPKIDVPAAEPPATSDATTARPLDLPTKTVPVSTETPKVTGPAKPADPPAANGNAGKKKLFSPSRRGPFSAGRTALPKKSNVTLDEKPSETTSETTAPKSDPPAADAGPALPQIQVKDGADLLAPDNESIDRKAP